MAIKSYIDLMSDWLSGRPGSAANVTTMPRGIIRIREQIAQAATEVTFTWPSPGIKALKLTVTQDTAGTVELKDSLAYCIDPPSVAVRTAWLTEGNSIGVDSQRYSIPVNSSEEMVFTSPITTFGFKRDDGTGTLRVFAAGVEA